MSELDKLQKLREGLIKQIEEVEERITQEIKRITGELRKK